MPVEVVSAEATELFVGDESNPLQIVRVTTTARGGPARVYLEGRALSTPQPMDIAAYGQFGVEVAVDTQGAHDVRYSLRCGWTTAAKTKLPTRKIE